MSDTQAVCVIDNTELSLSTVYFVDADSIVGSLTALSPLMLIAIVAVMINCMIVAAHANK